MVYKMKGPTFFKGAVSTTGYKKDSPDVNNKYNIIPSSNITMKNVEFDVRGEDNLGNVKIMKPGKNYKFPGDNVLEMPIYDKK